MTGFWNYLQVGQLLLGLGSSKVQKDAEAAMYSPADDQ